MKHFYLYASSNDNKNLFPENEGSDFTVEIPKYLHLPKGKWEVSLQEIRVVGTSSNPTNRDFKVICSLCEPDPVYGEQILRRVWFKGGKGFQNRYNVPFYVPLISTDIKRFKITLEPLHDLYTEIPIKSCELTLHFRKNVV